MAEVSAAGYQDLRDYIQATWKYIALCDGSGTEIMRLLVGTDARANWTHQAGANPLEITVMLAGTDSELSSKPKTFAQTKLYKVASNGSAFTGETHTQFTFEANEDTLTVKTQIQCPRIG